MVSTAKQKFLPRNCRTCSLLNRDDPCTIADPEMARRSEASAETWSIGQYDMSSDDSAEEEEDFSQPAAKRRRLSAESVEIEDDQTRSAAYVAPSRVKSQKEIRVDQRPDQNQNKNGGYSARKEGDHSTLNGLSVKTTQDDFSSLDVAPWLVHSLRTMQIHHPTEIQRTCIPEILNGRDCIGGSCTGTGKTVAFAVPILQKWSEDPYGIYAVILTPTRELALQIYEQFTALGAPQALKTVLITGGTEMRSQAQALNRRPHVVVATPGRLADHIAQSGEETVKGLRRTKVVVFDEADRLLSSSAGMLTDIAACLNALPPASDRLTLLFTATVTPEVRALKDQPRPQTRLPLFISEIQEHGDGEVASGVTPLLPTKLKQTYLQVPPAQKDAFLYVLLVHLLTSTASKDSQIIVFANRTATTDMLHRTLHKLLDLTHNSKDPEHAAISHLSAKTVTSLSSALPQNQRQSNLSSFRASTARVLICTDLASRGLDIPSVSHVINYDVVRDPIDYVHRVGRTARAGRSGTSITFVGPRDVELLLAVEEYTKGKMTEWKTETQEEVNLETRVIRGRTLKDVGEARMEALREIESGKDAKGYRSKLKKKKR